MKTFDPTKPCRYRNGEPARIICTDSGDELYPIISITKQGVSITHDTKGLAGVGQLSYYDLINIPSKKTVEMGVNVYPCVCCYVCGCLIEAYESDFKTIIKTILCALSGAITYAAISYWIL